MQWGSENGSQDAVESDAEDEAYWSQYDGTTIHYTGSAVGVNVPEAVAFRDQDETSYKEGYNEVETAIASNTTTSAPEVSVHRTEPMTRENEPVHNEAVQDYIRATVRNLRQLASRCGISHQRFTEIISEENNP
jgi:hypothetical protein